VLLIPGGNKYRNQISVFPGRTGKFRIGNKIKKSNSEPKNKKQENKINKYHN
jgi:hypothetical protein